MRLIDMDVAIRAAVEYIEDWNRMQSMYHRRKLTEKFMALPTVDTIPVVHGRWIDIDSETYTWKIRCSKCGHERSMMSTGQIYPMYCENCGARMDGDGNQ